MQLVIKIKYVEFEDNHKIFKKTCGNVKGFLPETDKKIVTRPYGHGRPLTTMGDIWGQLIAIYTYFNLAFSLWRNLRQVFAVALQSAQSHKWNNKQ